jgi:hypothetical protein
MLACGNACLQQRCCLHFKRVLCILGASPRSRSALQVWPCPPHQPRCMSKMHEHPRVHDRRPRTNRERRGHPARMSPFCSEPGITPCAKACVGELEGGAAFIHAQLMALPPSNATGVLSTRHMNIADNSPTVAQYNPNDTHHTTHHMHKLHFSDSVPRFQKPP